ncbi:hypothetical protein BDY21DRAFT_371936 [Lineolata rhizophorae]|uniref:Uncharacterized protein n=1 Tax=Lineolata rhizophorae TaxID=578093 RepID=A0A6A6P0X3_9PEZI|nr:hypothetical protein BDY21DRAFT_371936 [Lineolata rhizophorae]
MSHPFWDKYLKFEKRVEATDRIFAALDLVVHIPLHQSTRYLEWHLQPLIPAQLTNWRHQKSSTISRKELASSRLIYARTQLETTKRWQFEQIT